MQKTNTLLEGISKHFMTKQEQRVKKALCQLLIDQGHRKYAERFWKFDFNLVDSTIHPEFVAAISFDEATVFLSNGFLKGPTLFSQLDVLMRHELAHNLMMHQIRLMHIFKKLHADDPDKAYKSIRYSASLHDLLNHIEDFEISNKRYTSKDKEIARNILLNGETIKGLVTEDFRDWDKMSLEEMYNMLSEELDKINDAIRSDPTWLPTDQLQQREAAMIALYADYESPSEIHRPMADFIKSSYFKDKLSDDAKTFIENLYNSFKEISEDPKKKPLLLDIVKAISESRPQEAFDIANPVTGEVVNTLYTAEEKGLANDILKNLGGNVKFPDTVVLKKATHSKEYTDAWNKAIEKLDTKAFDDETLAQIADAIDRA